MLASTLTRIGLTTLLTLGGVLFVWQILAPSVAAQVNIESYRDTLSSSAPSALSNHTLHFVTQTAIPPGAHFELTPPSGFSVIATSSFAERNVELRVNGVSRPATSTQLSEYDYVSITTGEPGEIRYELDSALDGVSAGDTLELRVGNHTSEAIQPVTSTSTVTETDSEGNTSTTTATTTTPGDSPGIRNASTTGTQEVSLRIYDGSLLARAGFLVALVQQVTAGPVDTRLQFPTVLSEGAPDGDVSGTVRGVEVSVKSDRFAICRHSREPGVPYAEMTGEFDREDFWVLHTFTRDVEPGQDYTYYVRCIDQEDNVNEEDYEISFSIAEEPSGEPDEDGDLEGGGSGSDDGSEGDDDGGAAGDGEGDETTEDTTPVSGGGAGGGGGGSAGSGGSGAGGGFEDEDGPFESGDARIIINGFAYPNSEVVILVDGNEFETTTANAEGRYDITIDGIARGVYTFGVYGIDANDVRSSTFSTSFTVSGARTSSLSNVNVPPSIQVNPDPVNPGEPLTFSGYTIPDAEVTIEHETEGSAASQQTFTATSDSSGAWEYQADSSGFPTGPHRLRARAEQEGGPRTNFSQYTRYGVGDAVTDEVTADLNQDGRVDLVDFSILLFWWETDGGDSNPPADINQDGVVNLVDFSILLFNWTG